MRGDLLAVPEEQRRVVAAGLEAKPWARCRTSSTRRAERNVSARLERWAGSPIRFRPALPTVVRRAAVTAMAA